MTIEENAVTLRAGPNGNFLVTQKDDYVDCKVTAELAASEGAEAFLVVRAPVRTTTGRRSVRACSTIGAESPRER